MRYASKALIAVLLLGALGFIASDAYAGPCSVSQARKYNRVAHRAYVRAAKRESQARYVLAATRRYSKMYGSSTGRWVKLALDVGWSRGELGTLMRIIDAESGGNPLAVNPTTRCSGLLQLHPCWWQGKWFFNPFDPKMNLRYGLIVKRTAGWASWTTY